MGTALLLILTLLTVVHSLPAPTFHPITAMASCMSATILLALCLVSACSAYFMPGMGMGMMGYGVGGGHQVSSHQVTPWGVQSHHQSSRQHYPGMYGMMGGMYPGMYGMGGMGGMYGMNHMYGMGMNHMGMW